MYIQLNHFSVHLKHNIKKKTNYTSIKKVNPPPPKKSKPQTKQPQQHNKKRAITSTSYQGSVVQGTLPPGSQESVLQESHF